MSRIVLLLGCCLALVFAWPVDAATRKISDLSAQQIAALEESEQRLAAYDHALQSLDDSRLRRKIGSSDYATRKNALIILICDEAQFQNAVLTKDSNKPEPTTEDVLSTIAKSSEAVFDYALQIVPHFFAGR
jgi:hypothetical protein